MQRRHVDENGCWVWTGAKTSAGYGQIRNGANRWLYVHRVAAQVLGGLDIDGRVVMHSCDNPPCFNPAHLSAGSHADNRADSIAKDRHAYGERSGRRTLDEEQVLAILDMLSWQVPQREVATVFGISAGHVSDIGSGKSWGHLLPRGEDSERALLDAWDAGAHTGGEARG